MDVELAVLAGSDGGSVVAVAAEPLVSSVLLVLVQWTLAVVEQVLQGLVQAKQAVY